MASKALIVATILMVIEGIKGAKREYSPYGAPPNYLPIQPKRAVAILGENGITSPEGVFGIVTFYQSGASSPVLVNGTIWNLAPGAHGLHVHKSGDLREGCASAGTHLNPLKMNHGDRTGSDRHLGDMGNIDAYGGTATFEFSISLPLFGAHSAVGRAIVVHEKRDDLGRGNNAESKKTGNSGARLACGVIALIE